MKKILKYMKKINNTGSILSIASLVILILTTNGVHLDGSKIMVTTKSICSILLVLGVLNNPHTKGLDMPGIKGSGISA